VLWRVQRAALQLQGLQPSDAQLIAWRNSYGAEFTRERFVEAMVSRRHAPPRSRSGVGVLMARPRCCAQIEFVGEEPAEFSATEWCVDNALLRD
jgi:hypothetical protein